MQKAVVVAIAAAVVVVVVVVWLLLLLLLLLLPLRVREPVGVALGHMVAFIFLAGDLGFQALVRYIYLRFIGWRLHVLGAQGFPGYPEESSSCFEYVQT